MRATLTGQPDLPSKHRCAPSRTRPTKTPVRLPHSPAGRSKQLRPQPHSTLFQSTCWFHQKNSFSVLSKLPSSEFCFNWRHSHPFTFNQTNRISPESIQNVDLLQSVRRGQEVRSGEPEATSCPLQSDIPAKKTYRFLSQFLNQLVFRWNLTRTVRRDFDKRERHWNLLDQKK